jgi:hypothetical protein
MTGRTRRPSIPAAGPLMRALRSELERLGTLQTP